MVEYTGGEVIALIAPLFGRPAEDLTMYVLVAWTEDGKLVWLTNGLVQGQTGVLPAASNLVAAAHTLINQDMADRHA